MICKKDVILWFKELESYKRIDTMCALLNMCLPFELRFLGTCLEELGRRDSQELRGMELRVNNPQDLTTDVLACQQGEPTDKKIRRKMAMYLALIRASNRTCVTEIFRTIEAWGERDFHSMTDADTLQELLLVYMMAANHPIFSFEQHMKCTEIFEKIKENKLVCDSPPPSVQYYENSMGYGQQQQQQPPQPHLQQTTQLSQPDLRQPLAMTHQDMMQQQHALHALHLSGQHQAQMQVPPPTMQVLPQGTLPLNFQQGHMTKLIPSDSSLPHQLTVDGLHVVSPSNTIPMDPNTIMRHPDATWALRTYPPPLDQPPPAPSPIVSQHSSPASSRATSPNRPLPPSSGGGGMHPMSQQQQRRMGGGGGSMKNIRRPSVETTPPPMASQQQQQQMLANDLILPQNMKHDEVVDGSGQQLQSLIRNGYTRSGHQRMKANMYQQQQQQQTSVNQQQQQHYQTLPPGSYTIGLGYAMQSMSLGDPSLSHHMDGGMSSLSSTKSNGSDSGSPLGSCAEVSPPETPTLMTNSTSSSGGGGGGGNMRMSPSDHQPQQQQPQKMHHQRGYSNQMGGRMNGRFDKMLPVSATSGAPPAGSTIVYAQAAPTHQHQMTQQQQQQQQQQSQQQMYASGGSDIILAPGGNAGAGGNIMQSSLTGGSSNNNVSGQTGGGNAAATSTSNSNNNMTNAAPATATAVLISSASPAGNVISTNSVILQQHQPQYSTTFPFHIATATRPPPLITHNPSMAPPPAPPTFRMSGFQLPPNDVLYPYHHPSGGLTFLSSAGAPVGMRAASASAVAAATPTAQPPPPLATVPSPLLSSPYAPLAAPLPTNKPPPPVSCYNCGSQQHCGRDCPEASMDDVTRNAIYKLDYSVSAAASNMSPTATTTTPGGSSSGTGASGTGSSSSSSSSGQLEHSKASEGNGSAAANSAASATSSAAAAAASVSGPVNTK